MSVTLEIYTPEKKFLKKKADKIVLPVLEGNLTIIHGRAPRSQLLAKGDVLLLDVENNVLKKWCIEGGIAEIAEDVCKIATEKVEE